MIRWEDQKLNTSAKFISNTLRPEQEPKTLSACKEVIVNLMTGIGDYVLAKLSEAFNRRTFLARHCISTNLMSVKTHDGVVNKWGFAFCVKNLFVLNGSQFISSGAENPIFNNCDTGVAKLSVFSAAM